MFHLNVDTRLRFAPSKATTGSGGHESVFAGLEVTPCVEPPGLVAVLGEGHEAVQGRRTGRLPFFLLHEVKDDILGGVGIVFHDIRRRPFPDLDRQPDVGSFFELEASATVRQTML
jgi:hypothetical protein